MTDTLEPADPDQLVTGVQTTVRAEQHVIYIDGRLLVCTGFPGDQQCSAKTAKGKRCKNPIEYGQVAGWLPVSIDNIGQVEAYDLRTGRLGAVTADGAERWLAQRCEGHWPDAVGATEPEWEPFDSATHERLVTRTGTRGLVWSPEHGVVDHG